jgi:hypothetical protein
MPSTNVSEQDPRAMAAYLYALNPTARSGNGSGQFCVELLG